MPELSLRYRLLLFLYSNSNIAGCVLALFGLGLYFGGIIDRGWGLITAGLYGMGWIGWYRRKAEVGPMATDMSAEMLHDAFTRLVATAKTLPPEAKSKLTSIEQRLAGLLPRLAELRESADARAAHTISQTVLSYLPDAINRYLKLPPAFAALHVVTDGKTPTKLLIEQLGVLDQTLGEIETNLYSGDAVALAANGRFLSDKFGNTRSLF
ncbi:hypothetical protein [Parachitinimonas caeni]|uniref:5-bromo-4-chloroindolyl phosphate hydrolysis protein n=1 Tax=Parachitinimonas caeni TaxID=3031301 RepID=A0ABT7E5Z8_9NEIS|nr:hypothetical protein [Parachitinimonas caeni]MDK2126788.1 hypothetical protein [Parachitinimonas caeni]